MADTTLDLISMADIARLADQSRATVGNWKSRNPDFPPERGRGPRGPLYDRAEVISWLEATNRLDKRPHDVAAIGHLIDQFRGRLKTEDALLTLLVLLTLMSESSPPPGHWARSRPEWQQIRSADPHELARTARSAIRARISFADDLLRDAELPTQFIEAAVSTLSEFDRDRLSVIADALIEHSANAIGHRGREYLTPESVRRLVIGLADPVGVVYNPATGFGQLMVDAASAHANPREVTDSGRQHLTGDESNYRIWAIAQLNLKIHSVYADIAIGDVFSRDPQPLVRADRVIAVPPWNQKLSIDQLSKNDPRWIYGEPGSNDGNAAWIQHCLYHVADEGRAVLVLPNSALFEIGRAGRIRQRIIKAGLLDAVIALPPGLFAWTSVPCAVLVFSKSREGRSAQPPSLMVDLSDSGERQSSQTTELASDLIDEAAQTYREWTMGEPPQMENAAVAGFDDIAANDFVIVPARYMPVRHDAPNVDEARRKKREVLRRLETLSAASREADEHLSKLLGTTR
jgi:type I restriction-modification system DNA methylase subunit